uniref:AAA ATPase domain-containing protein n=1 Tax=Candidatus Kentrum sp. LFY TaxID=2126342 RepID=A0A450UAG0_9GAMM|nr:MAG: AAA ATPase domain-containing protein [Candidatus Kentron sp. LFY]
MSHEAGVIERWGKGIENMRKACRDEKVPEPMFEYDAPGFLVRFWNRGLVVSLSQILTSQVFIGYSRKDKPFLDELRTHLAPYLRSGSVRAWSDKEIPPGARWLHDMEKTHDKARVAVLLVSPDFLASEFIHDNELGSFLQGAEAGGITILWILVRACAYTGTSLKDYRAVVSPPGRPLARMEGAERDDAWLAVCEEIKKAVAKAEAAAEATEKNIQTDPRVEPSAPVGTVPSSSQSAPKSIAPSRLLELGVTERFHELVGREQEQQLLRHAWNDDTTRILVLVAEGGVGKTSLVADWLVEHFVTTGWADVDAFFDWSFYSQGTRDQSSATSGQFLDAALRHFGDTALADSAASADQKAEGLARRVAARRALLILDGLEPLQHPSRQRELAGRLKDAGMGRFLKVLAQTSEHGGGLCVVTTRVPVVDLRRFESQGQKQGTVRQHPLDQLSPEATARLLHGAGACRAGSADIGFDDGELLQAAEEIQGHALTAQLLGGYVKHAHGGDIRRRNRVDWPALDVEQEGHAGSVMRAYEHWFRQNGTTGERQLAVLRLLGLFDRPADAGCLAALRRAPAISGLTEPLVALAEGDWNALINRFATEHRLISVVGSDEEARLDCHPLIRAWFAHELREEQNTAWREGHRRLFEHLITTTEPLPDTLEGLQPLYQAVAHGCHAGLQQRVLDEVFRDRILRGTDQSDGYYSIRKLGAMAEDLGAVACFFQEPWHRLLQNLSRPDQAWLFNQAAQLLGNFGRVAEALEPMRVGLEMAEKQKDWRNAATAVANLGELELLIGGIRVAVKMTARSVELAERSGDLPARIGSRAIYAHARHQAGRYTKAKRRFAEAEGLQAEFQPESPRLYLDRGFRYCDLLLGEAERAAWRVLFLSAGRVAARDGVDSASALEQDWGACVLDCARVIERATETLGWVEADEDKLAIALDRLILGRAGLYRALLSRYRKNKDTEGTACAKPQPASAWARGANVSERRDTASGRSDAAAAGHPSEAGPQAFPSLPEKTAATIEEHLDDAVNGLREANEISLLPHGLVTRAWLRLLLGDRDGGIADLDEAWDIAKRGPMPLFLVDILLGRARLFPEASRDGLPEHWRTPRDEIREARRLIEKHGYHRRDRELADVEAVL